MEITGVHAIMLKMAADKSERVRQFLRNMPSPIERAIADFGDGKIDVYSMLMGVTFDVVGYIHGAVVEHGSSGSFAKVSLRSRVSDIELEVRMPIAEFVDAQNAIQAVNNDHTSQRGLVTVFGCSISDMEPLRMEENRTHAFSLFLAMPPQISGTISGFAESVCYGFKRRAIPEWFVFTSTKR